MLAGMQQLLEKKKQNAAEAPKSPPKQQPRTPSGTIAGSPQRIFPLRSPKTKKRRAAGAVDELPDGWGTFTKSRKEGARAGKTDTYYKAPDGKVLPSLAQAKKYAEKLQGAAK